VLAACIANGLVTETPPGARATIAVGADGRAQVRVEPASLLRDAEWATVTAWQGGGLEVQHLDAQGRTSGPIPLTGEWKAILRIHQGRAVAGAPVRLPEDRAIPAPEVPAPRTAATRPLVRDSQVLQRERKDDVPGGLWAAGMATVLALYLAFLTALAWGVGRVGRASAARRDLPGVQREERALVGPEAAGVATDRADVGARRVVVE
jgi:hypothetical protein